MSAAMQGKCECARRSVVIDLADEYICFSLGTVVRSVLAH
jgi:hypothetical protein